MIWRLGLWFIFALQVVAFSDSWAEWCLWLPGLLLAVSGLHAGRRAWFCGSDLFWITFLVLFVVAPASQLEHDRFLGAISVRGLIYRDGPIQLAVLAADLFAAVVVGCQLWWRHGTGEAPPGPVGPGPDDRVGERFILGLLALDLAMLASLVFGLDTWRFIIEGRNYPARLYGASQNISSLVNAIYQLIPMATVLCALFRWQSLRDRRSRFLLLASLILLALFANPLNTARFQFAAFVALLGLSWFRGRVPLGISFAGLAMFVILVMPFMNYMRHGVSQADEDAFDVRSGYNRLDFDAFSMSVHCLHRQEDPEWGTPGRYLLSSALFFVPRGLWPGKAQPTSMDLGDDLMLHFHGWFNNLSCPIYMDFHLDLGWIGVVLAGLLVGSGVVAADRVVDRWGASGFLARALAASWIGFLPILLRGALGAVIGFFAGAAAVFIVVSWLLSRDPSPAKIPGSAAVPPRPPGLPPG